MKRFPLLNLGALVILGVFIWMQDTSWMNDVGGTLPVFAALTLFIWFTLPWEWKANPGKPQFLRTMAALGLSLAGIAVDSTLLLAIGWVLFFDIFQTTFLEKFQRRFLLLPLVGFPWLVQDFHAHGWLHPWAGWAVLCVTYVLSQGLVRVLTVKRAKHGEQPNPGRTVSPENMALSKIES